MSKVKAVTITCVILKAGFLECVSRRIKVLDTFRHIHTNAHNQSQPSNKSQRARKKVAHVELL